MDADCKEEECITGGVIMADNRCGMQMQKRGHETIS